MIPTSVCDVERVLFLGGCPVDRIGPPSCSLIDQIYNKLLIPFRNIAS